MNKLLSFHSDKKIKAKYVDRVKAHAKADEIIKGQYWKNGNGCAVGCTLHSNQHDDYETELGVTWRLALVEDSLFENMPNDQAKKFPLQFLQAIPVGVDTNLVFKKWVIWVLLDKKHGLANMVKDKDAAKALKAIGELYKKSMKKEIPQSEWKKLADKYYSASAYASAYASASASASASAYTSASASASAYASASASAYAYASAYASDDYERERTKHILRMRDKLLELLKAAKPEKAK